MMNLLCKMKSNHEIVGNQFLLELLSCAPNIHQMDDEEQRPRGFLSP